MLQIFLVEYFRIQWINLDAQELRAHSEINHSQELGQLHLDFVQNQAGPEKLQNVPVDNEEDWIGILMEKERYHCFASFKANTDN